MSLVGPLAVGQTAYSGKVEIGAGDAVPLSNAHGAEVVLAVHSHGPASTGDELASQLSSFTGGCLVFNGADGFATGPEDLPDAPGECSTLQRALHQQRGSPAAGGGAEPPPSAAPATDRLASRIPSLVTS